MEEWKDILGYEGYYRVSNLGSVKALARNVIYATGVVHAFKERIICVNLKRTGYFNVALCRDGKCKTFLLHRLVATAFLDRDNDSQNVNHRNGVKTDNRAVNLEWVTPSQNTQHALVNKLLPAGERSVFAKLSHADAEFIRLLGRTKLFTNLHVAKLYNVSPSVIDKVIQNKTYKREYA